MKTAVRTLLAIAAIATLPACMATAPVEHAGDPTRPVFVVRQGIFSTNSVDGQTYAIEVVNNSSRTIKYLRVKARASNRVGDPVADRVSGRFEAEGEMVGPLEPNRTSRPRWLLWYASDIQCANLTELTVLWMDGTESKFQGEQLLRLVKPSEQNCKRFG
jgi:hypothetical protein